jgi:hypothetical protein
MSASRKLIMISACRIRHLRNQQQALRELETTLVQRKLVPSWVLQLEKRRLQMTIATLNGDHSQLLHQAKSDSNCGANVDASHSERRAIDCVGAQEIPMPLGTPPTEHRGTCSCTGEAGTLSCCAGGGGGGESARPSNCGIEA